MRIGSNLLTLGILHYDDDESSEGGMKWLAYSHKLIHEFMGAFFACRCVLHSGVGVFCVFQTQFTKEKNKYIPKRKGNWVKTFCQFKHIIMYFYQDNYLYFPFLLSE